MLVVEDEPPACDLLVTILEDDGDEVCAEADGSAALEAATTLKPDLALPDGARRAIVDYIEVIFNRRRLHTSLEFLHHHKAA